MEKPRWQERRGVAPFVSDEIINPGVPARRINEIVQGKRGITANTALRLGQYFGMSPQFWINLQTHYDLEVESDKIADSLKREIRVYEGANLAP
jgi:plasmid maintenance system antidote protein VapI